MNDSPQPFENIYRAPSEAGDSEPPPDRFALPVIGIGALVALHVVTFGLYDLVWFYSRWSALRAGFSLKISPLGRSLFAVFFVHELFRHIDQVARDAGAKETWSPKRQATLYVLLAVTSAILGQLDIGPAFLGLFVLGALQPLPLVSAQIVINAAQRSHADPRARSGAAAPGHR